MFSNKKIVNILFTINLCLFVFFSIIIICYINKYNVLKNTISSYESDINKYKVQNEKFKEMEKYVEKISEFSPRVGGRIIETLKDLEDLNTDEIDQQFKGLPITFNGMKTYENKGDHTFGKYGKLMYPFLKLPFRDMENISRPDLNTFVTSEYGYGPITVMIGGKWKTIWRNHTAIDITNEHNKAVYASAAGIVIDAGNDKYNGNYILLLHNINGKLYVTGYAHLAFRLVNIGDKVTDETIIAKSGDTGESCFGEHLHFMVGEVYKTIKLKNGKIKYYWFTLNSLYSSTYGMEPSDKRYYDII